MVHDGGVIIAHHRIIIKKSRGIEKSRPNRILICVAVTWRTLSRRYLWPPTITLVCISKLFLTV